jgi:DNA-binding response OmpR family regulator
MLKILPMVPALPYNYQGKNNMSDEKLAYSILYVEDEEEIRENYVQYLQRFYTNIFQAKTAEEAYKIYKNKKPDILIVDIRLPGKSGIEFLQDIRESDQSIKAIVLTAMSDIDTLVNATELKLTKYLIKPISRNELKEAIDQAVKEIVDYTTYANRIIYVNDSMHWDKDKEKLIFNGKEIFFTRKERALLGLLFENVNNVVKSEDIVFELWYDYDDAKIASLKTLVKTLRKKLPHNFIKNVFGVGYTVEV